MRICRRRGALPNVVDMTQTDNTAVSFTGAVKTTASHCWLRDLSA